MPICTPLTDTNIGKVAVCTSGTRPTGADRYAGKHIWETDTGRELVYNGTNWIVMYSPQATFTPTLTGMAIGTGGSAANTATWSFSGGIVSVGGRIVFGTVGATLPAAGVDLIVSLPPGIAVAAKSFIMYFGDITITIGANEYEGYFAWTSFGAAGIVRTINSNVTHATAAVTSNVLPAAWAAGDGLNYSYAALASLT